MTTQPSTGPRPIDAIHADIHERVGDDYDVLGLALELEAVAGLAGRAAALTAVEEAVRANRHPADVALRWRSAQHWNAALDRVLAVLAKLQEDEQ